MPNPATERMARALRIAGIKFEQEYRFHPQRKFRFDFALPQHKIAIEYEGGIFVGGRHTRGVTYSRDCEKYNLATLEGWNVLRYTPLDLSKKNGEFRVVADVETLIINKQKGAIYGSSKEKEGSSENGKSYKKSAV